MFKFSILAMGLTVAAFAASLALLRYPTEDSAYVVSVWAGLAIVVGACLAIGSRQPSKSFWIGFVVASLAARYIDAPNRTQFKSIPAFSGNISTWVDDYFLQDMKGNPGTTSYYLEPGNEWVTYETRDDKGRIQRTGIMGTQSAKAKGIDIAALPAAPDGASFRTIVKQLLMLGIGLIGGGLSYLSRRRSMNPRP